MADETRKPSASDKDVDPALAETIPPEAVAPEPLPPGIRAAGQERSALEALLGDGYAETLRPTDPVGAAETAETVLAMEEPGKKRTEPATDPGDADPLTAAPKPPPSDVTAGKRLAELVDERLTAEHPGRYRLHAELGRGGIGRVVVASDRHLGRQVAVKELLPHHVGGGGSQSAGSGTSTRTAAEIRFLDEARITGQLEHPGIVPVYELGQRADGTVYYTMRLLKGRTLAEALEGRDLRGRLDLLPNCLDLCHAMAFAHSRGVIHRDLKPANVMLGEFGETVVLDWGLARVQGQEDHRQGALARDLAELRDVTGTHTVAGAALGTPAYMPPEQARGAVDEIDERSDVYSLGAILYEVLTGRTPHRGRSALSILDAVQKNAVTPPQEIEPEAPPELAAIALRALAREPADRYPSARELADDVRRFQTGGLVRAHRYSFSELLWRFVRRHRATLAAGAAMAAIALGVWFYRGYRERQTAREAARRHHARVTAQVQEILKQTARGSPERNWLDIYTFKLIALKEPLVEDLLIRALKHPKEDVRHLAARALGGLKSGRAVPALCARLKRGAEKSDTVVIAVINALGIIGDPRAEDPVDEARFRHGQRGHVWASTTLAYRMIPLPDVDLRRLTANQLVDRGRKLVNKGRPREALRLYELATRKDPRLARAWNNRANQEKRYGRYQEALRSYTRAIALEPDRPAHLNNRALLKQSSGDFQGALADIDKAVALKEQRDITLSTRGLILRAMGRYDEALADYRRVLALKPKKVSIYRTMAVLWRDRGDLEQALALLNLALATRPRYRGALLSRAAIRLMKGDLAGALTDMDRVLGLNPASISGRLLRSRIRLARGNRAGAADDADQAVALNKERPSAWDGRAVFFHLRLGRYKEALRDLAQAVALAPRAGGNEHWYRFHYLAVALRAGRRDKGLAILNALKPSDPPRWQDRVARYLAGVRRQPLLPLLASGQTRRRCAAHLYQGLRAELDGRREQAITNYRAAVATRQNLLHEYVLAADSLKALGAGDQTVP